MNTHEDDRRVLFEMKPSTGNFVTCKALVAKRGCVVGDHYHLNKTERFMLVSGRAEQVIIGDEVFNDVTEPTEWIVPPRTYHLFKLDSGSFLVGTATEFFDPDDEVPGRP